LLNDAFKLACNFVGSPAERGWRIIKLGQRTLRAPDGTGALMTQTKLCEPLQWSATFSSAPVFASQPSRWKSAPAARWTGTDAAMPQPPLDHHVLVMHLGGDKRVSRSGAGLRQVFSVPLGGLTIIPAGCAFDWRTEGPIDFAHLYIAPDRLNRTVGAVFERDPSPFVLHDKVGADDPLLRALTAAILREVEAKTAPRAYLESLFESALVQIVQRHSNVGDMRQIARHTLAPTRLRRVLEHIETSLCGDLELKALADVAGLSPFHFSRAFHKAVGEPPLAYVMRRRMQIARTLLRTTTLPIADVAARAGFNSSSYFATAFRRHAERSPSDYRYDRGRGAI
jgi:AraC family transcriptional regulator